MNGKDKSVLIRCIKKESLEYAMLDYSRYDENSPEFNRVDNAEFHRLLKLVNIYHDRNKENHEQYWGDLKSYLLKEIPELKGWCEYPEYKFEHDEYSEKHGHEAWTRKVYGAKYTEDTLND